jgi:cation transport regulator ChaC
MNTPRVSEAQSAAAAALLISEVETELDARGFLSRDDSFFDKPLLLFGYGSLLWRPEPEFANPRPCRALGVVRRFWQLSDDHRGTPERPGRVCALIEPAKLDCDADTPLGATAAEVASAGAAARPPISAALYDEAMSTSGALFELPAHLARDTMRRLAAREKAGYRLASVRCELDEAGESGAVPRRLSALTFVARAGSQYIVPRGPERSAAATAAVVLRARGPSGANLAYFLALLGALRGRASPDAHLAAVLRELQRLDAAAVAAAAAELGVALGGGEGEGADG